MWQDLFKKVVVSNRLARKQIEMARALEFNRAWAEAETLSKRIPESKEPRMWQWRNVNRQREVRGKSWGGEGGDPVDEMPGGVGEGQGSQDNELGGDKERAWVSHVHSRELT